VRKFWKLAVVASTAAIVGAFAAPAGATPPAGYGFDGSAHVVVGAGSDTTYRVQVDITKLYNLSGLAGCPHVTGTGTNQNACSSDITTNLGNYQGDTFAQANPVGSGGGIGALNANGGATGVHQGTVNDLVNPSTTHSVGTTSGSSTVTDASIAAGDLGKSVRAVGIPEGAFVGSVNAGVSFTLSSAPNVNNALTATATAGGVTATFAKYGCAGNTTNTLPDFARSSRAASTSGGSAPCGNELAADTFWGYAQDGVEVVGFNHHGDLLNALGAGHLTPDDIKNIYSCTGGTGTGGRVRWSDVIPGVTPGGPDDGDIVPWAMNTASGTFATFRDWVRTNATAAGSFTPNAGSCVRTLNGGGLPLENDIKPLVNTPASLSTSATSADNPENWLWWGSFGVFSAFPYTSSYTRSATLVTAKAAAINGVLPGTANILARTWTISRTLFHVTRKADADCVKTGTACNFSGNPGPALPAGGTDLNITGGTSGVGGAIREYTRFMCRPDATSQGIDPFTGVNFNNEITSAIQATNFTTIRNASKTAGSRCEVFS
jgi:hypothetical protein